MRNSLKEDKYAIKLENITMEFNLHREKLDSVKEYFINLVKGDVKRNSFKALDDVSFTIEKGDRVGVLGLNGAGKSTLMKVIAGVFEPSSGKVYKQGVIAPMIELGAGFDNQYTGAENIFLYGAVLGHSRKYMQEKFHKIVEFSELGDFIDVPLKNYSSGMRARLGFSIATMVKPDILILDEVLSVGDARFKKKSEEKLLSMMDEKTTVLFVSHNLAQVKRICNKAMILHKGKLVDFGDIEEIAKKYEEMTK
ncbi:MAG: ABC transporter ATP-binding protein [Lachnospiraceae bacterium]|nr:ABC transporter ATP-binding protein [Lachnospiraceae bacterium]